MLDCCSPRYYGRGRAISLLSGGADYRASNTCNQPTFPFSLSLPFSNARRPIFNFLPRGACGGGETLVRFAKRATGEKRVSSISSIANNTDLESARQGGRFLSFPTPSCVYRARPSRQDNNSIGNRNYGAPFPDTEARAPRFPSPLRDQTYHCQCKQRHYRPPSNPQLSTILFRYRFPRGIRPGRNIDRYLGVRLSLSIRSPPETFPGRASFRRRSSRENRFKIVTRSRDDN